MLGFGEIFTRLILAVALGSLFGLERELRHKEAGMRTNILVALGSALVMITSLSFEGSPATIASGVIAGIGFLGGGLIIRSEGRVHGITTAATVWVVAALGLACGAGYFEAAMAAGIIGLVVLYFLGWTKVREAAKLND